MIKEFNEGRGIEVIEDEGMKGVSGNVAISDQGHDTVSISVFETEDSNVYFTIISKSEAIDLFERMLKILKRPPSKHQTA
jgi:hypothetical protein